MSVKLNKLFSEIPLININELTYISNYKNNIDSWSESLVHLELGEAAKQIFTTLLEIRSLNCDDFTRQTLLEKSENSVTHLLASLEQHYLSNSLLDTKRDQQIADLVLEIKAHHALVYADIFKRSHQALVTNKFSFFEFNQKKKLNILRKQSAFYALQNFHKLLSSLQLLYLDVPKFFWSSVYSIYHQARDFGFANDKVLETAEAHEVANIESAFVQLVLSSLLNSHKLRQTEVRDLSLFTNYWTELVKLTDEPDQHTQYAFNFLRDQSPRLYVKNEHLEKECYFINITNLSGYIDSVLQPNARYYSQYEQKNFTNVLKHHIQETLNPNNIRHSQRFTDEGTLEIALGITSAHFFLSYAQHFKETLGLEPSTSTHAPTQASLSTMLSDKEMQLSNKTHEQRFNAEITKIHSGGIVNRSENGYCLQWINETPRLLRAGEFMLVRDNASSPWNGAIIRWLKTNNEHNIEFGVEVFSKNMCPVAICIPKADTQPIYHPAILFAEDEGVFSIIVPSSQVFQEDQNLILRLGQIEIKMFLTRSTLLTQSCAKFMFDLLEKSKYPLLQQHFEQHLNKLNTKDLWDSLK